MKTLSKDKINQFLAKGGINLVQLSGNDNYVLVVCFKEKNFLVQMRKDSKGAWAYISTSYSLEEYDLLENIIKYLNKNKVYKIHEYKPLRGEIELKEEDRRAVLIQSSSLEIKTNKRIFSVLEENHFDISSLKASSGVLDSPELNYEDLLKDPEVKQRFDENHNELQKIGATYDSLNPEIKTAYESMRLSSGSKGIIFAGPTGTGKSFAARILADKAKAPLLNLNITQGTMVEDLIGQYVPDANGGYRFAEGPLLVAATQGYQIVLEEVNYGEPGILAKLNEFTDDTMYVQIFDKIYKKNPNFVVYMTMNPGYKGTQELNAALKNRFTFVDVPALSKKEFTERCVKYANSKGTTLNPELFNTLYDFAALIEKEGNSSRYHEEVHFSIRNAQRVIDYIVTPRSLEEFKNCICVQYINTLNADNDNSAKIEEFKNSSDINQEIKNLYNKYDLRKIEFEENDFEVDDLIEEVEDGSADSSSYDTEELDDLFSKFDE